MAIDVMGLEDLISGDDISGDDISGEDLMSGADDDLRRLLAVSGDDISGLLGNRAMIRKLRRKQLARAARGAMVVPRSVENSRRFPLGITPTNVLAPPSPDSQKDIKASPQVTFRPERLIIPSDIAAFFTIVDLKIGNRSQLVAAGEIPATVFSEVGVDANLRMDTAQISMEIVITVKNIDSSPRMFRAALLGTAVY